MGKFKGIVKLSKTNLQKIKNNESVVIDGQTYTKQEDTLYVPDLCVDIPTALNELSNNETDRYAKLSDIPEIVDGLTSSSATKTLSAKQGKTLNDNKLDKKPDGTNNLINSSNKISDVYLPDTILGQLLYGGTINQSGIATLSNNFKTKYNISDNTLDMTSVSAATYEGVYFIAQDTTTFTNATIIGVANVSTGDWIISYGNSWGKIDNTDAVTGVKGNEEVSYRTGNVNITAQNVGAEPAFTKNTAFNKDFETSTSNIKMNGSASVGSSTNIARADHVHPSDTTKVDKTTTIAGIELDGNISDSSLYSALGLGDVATHDVADNGVSDNDTSIPTTAQVKTYVDTNGGKIDTISVNGTNQTITNKNVDLSVYEVDHTNKSSVSLNTLVTPGNYGIADDCTNMPVAENGTLFVGEFDDGKYVRQIFFGADNKCYVRNSTATDNSTWSTWKEINDGKLDKVTSSAGDKRLYVINQDGTQTTVIMDYANTATGGHVPLRSSSGALMINDSTYSNSGQFTDGLQAINKNKLLERTTPLTGSSAPTTSTAGFVGQFYLDTTNNNTYQCIAVTGDGGNPEVFTYTWVQLLREANISAQRGIARL